MLWTLGFGADAMIAAIYMAITWFIVWPLVQTRQLASNRLGAATGAIFFSCGVGHGIHAVHVLLPAFGIEETAGLASRVGVEWHQVAWDLTTAAIGVYYISLRRIYGSLMRGAKLFEDLEENQRQALEINDKIVQGLVVAQAALAVDERATSEAALAQTLASAKHLISDLLSQLDDERQLEPGDLVRSSPAAIR
ncbi:MAG TPA: hypothetical protein VI916_10385 [Acidimicrobiia bacterium]|nr:hypothetical protein [Acidimicrobiia bacterium]